MPTDWSDAVKLRAGDLLARIRAQQQDTPLKLLEDLRKAGFLVNLDDTGQNLKVTPRGITDAHRDRLKAHKPGLLVLLREPPKFDFPVTWEDEWRIETDLLQRRRAAAWSPAARRELDKLLSTPKPSTEPEWEQWGENHVKVCYELLGPRGELPPAVYAAGSLWKVLAQGHGDAAPAPADCPFAAPGPAQPAAQAVPA